MYDIVFMKRWPLWYSIWSSRIKSLTTAVRVRQFSLTIYCACSNENVRAWQSLKVDLIWASNAEVGLCYCRFPPHVKKSVWERFFIATTKLRHNRKCGTRLERDEIKLHLSQISSKLLLLKQNPSFWFDLRFDTHSNDANTTPWQFPDFTKLPMLPYLYCLLKQV